MAAEMGLRIVSGDESLGRERFTIYEFIIY